MKVEICAKRFTNAYIIEEDGKEVGKIVKSSVRLLKFSEVYVIEYKGEEWKLEKKMLSGEVIGDNLIIKREKGSVNINGEPVKVNRKTKRSVIEYTFPDGNSVRIHLRAFLDDVLLLIKGRLLLGEIECKSAEDVKKLLAFFLLEQML